MTFLLTPPIVTSEGRGISIIQLGHMEMPETLRVDMFDWSVVQVLEHWRSEIGHLLAGHRNRGCIIYGLASDDGGNVAPYAWWKMFVVNGEVKFHEQLCIVENRRGMEVPIAPEQWWERIPAYSPYGDCSDDEPKRLVSEWTTTFEHLSAWCDQCDVLIAAIRAAEAEADGK